MSRVAQENISRVLDEVKQAVDALDNLKPVNNDQKSYEAMERQAKVYKDQLARGVLTLVGGALLDLHRIAMAMEKIASDLEDDDELFAVRDRQES